MDIAIAVQGFENMVFLVVEKGLKVREGERVESGCKVHEVVLGEEAREGKAKVATVHAVDEGVVLWAETKPVSGLYETDKVEVEER